MKMIPRQYWLELTVFLMDYHSGQWSRGYRLLCKLRIIHISSAVCKECRESEIYRYLVTNYSEKV